MAEQNRKNDRDISEEVSEELREAVETAAEVIETSRRLIVFTGAGISVESGIPPFRGPEGIWSRYDPKVLELSNFKRHPEGCWIAIKEIFYDFFGSAEPNRAHLILAEWEKRGIVATLITQNIDDMHYRAGSRNVVEYHGNSRLLRCTSCGKTVEADSGILDTLPPLCSCGGIYKPDFVFFGETIPVQAVINAENAAVETDVMLLIGTTGEVYPAAYLPEKAKANGALVIEINPYRSNYTGPVTDIFIRTTAVQGMELLDEVLKRKGMT